MKILCQMKNENLTSKTNEVPDGNKSLETWTDKFKKNVEYRVIRRVFVTLRWGTESPLQPRVSLKEKQSNHSPLWDSYICA